MFDLEAAQELVEGSKGKPPLARRNSGEDSKQSAKKAALAARSASRVLQSLPSQVHPFGLLYPHPWIHMPTSALHINSLIIYVCCNV